MIRGSRFQSWCKPRCGKIRRVWNLDFFYWIMCLRLECYNSDTFSSYIHIAPFMYSTLHVFPWKYFLIRMQWRMNLEISSASDRLHDLNIPYILSSSNCLSEVNELHETKFMFRVMEAHRNSKFLQAKWKLRTNILSVGPLGGARW